MTYAENTRVPAEKSRAEIETILRRYGATEFGYMTSPDAALVGFRANNRVLKFHLPLPMRTEKRFCQYESRGSLYERTEAAAEKLWDQEVRQRWRALALVIKAKLEAVASGITTFEEEFLAHIVMPGTKGQTVGQWLAPRLEEAHKNGKPPALEFKSE